MYANTNLNEIGEKLNFSSKFSVQKLKNNIFVETNLFLKIVINVFAIFDLTHFDLHPLKPSVHEQHSPSHPSIGAPLPGSGCFWIESS